MVLGGRSDPDEFSSDILLYQVNCNAWLLPDLTRKYCAPPGRDPGDLLQEPWPCPGMLTHPESLGPPQTPPAKLFSPVT